MRRYWKLVFGSLMVVYGLTFLVFPYYNCVFWVSFTGVVFVLWFGIDQRKEKISK